MPGAMALVSEVFVITSARFATTSSDGFDRKLCAESERLDYYLGPSCRFRTNINSE
jgi:hypothetical protein